MSPWKWDFVLSFWQALVSGGRAVLHSVEAETKVLSKPSLGLLQHQGQGPALGELITTVGGQASRQVSRQGPRRWWVSVMVNVGQRCFEGAGPRLWCQGLEVLFMFRLNRICKVGHQLID